MENKSMIKMMVTAMVWVGVLLMSIQGIMWIYNVEKQRSISEEVTIGTVASKNIKNASSGLFTSTPMRYQLKIEYQYEYKGKIYDGSRRVDVDKDVYLSYNIGDTFDVGNPVPKENENERAEKASEIQ